MSDHPTPDKMPTSDPNEKATPPDEVYEEFRKEVADDEGMPPPEVRLAQQQQMHDSLKDHVPQEVAQEGDLTSQVETLTRERDEYLDQWRRSTAEFQNYKKREDRLRSERERAANARLLKKLLPVLDDLQRASQHVPEALSNDDWVNGMLAIERKLWAVLEAEGVSTIEAEPGMDFDPEVHEALMTRESDDFHRDQIVDTLESGYRHESQVLRPARVVVAQ